MRARFAVLAAAGFVIVAGEAAALPPAGGFCLAPDFGLALVSADVIQDFYGPGLETKSSPTAVGFGGGIDYCVTSTFQIGARYDRLSEKYSVKLIAPTWQELDTWKPSADAILGHMRVVFGSDSTLWYGFSLYAGSYSLAGATASYVFSGALTGSSAASLTGSAFGGEVDFEIEKLLGPSLTLLFNVGYRSAKISDVEFTSGGRTATLLNADGSNAAIDFSGITAGVALRIYIGGYQTGG